LYDSLYSWTLLLALVASGVGALLFDYFLVMRLIRRGAPRVLVRIANIAGSLGLLCMILSIVVHFSFGHAARTQEPPGIAEFLMEHKAYWLVAAFILFSYLGPALLRAEDSNEV
jgi:hypothetical protein